MTSPRVYRILLAIWSILILALFFLALASPPQQKQVPRPIEARARTSAKSPPSNAPKFVDVARQSGIDFHLVCGGSEKLYILETMCGGIAVFDYDNDGWMDILLINGSTVEDMRAGKCHASKLYRNDHEGRFTDVTAKSGLTHCGWGYGVAIGDYDNDGWADVYVTYFDGGVLYRNNRDGTFSDVTAKANVGNPGRWGTSAAFGDYDNDGNLDLYIANYVSLDLDHLPEFGKGPFCQYRGIPVSCGPRGLKGSRDRLYHNNGNGTFADVSEKLNIDPEGYYGLGVLWLDYDKDGCLDLYVANDSSPSQLYHNDCKGGFTEVGAEAGVAYSADGREQAGMGLDSSDYDHDGWPDIVKTNFSDDTNNLYHNDGNGQFTDLAGPTNFGPVSIPFLGFGVKFFDYDNDGWKDIFVADGHVDPQVDGHSFGVTYAERPLLFHQRKGKFEELGLRAGADLSKPRVARGAAVGDFLNEGKQDIVISVLDGSPVLLRNMGAVSGHWLRIKTMGNRSNHDGYGASIEVKAGGLTQTEEVRANSSFESASDPRLHFGLGTARRVVSITIRWPSGVTDKITDEVADQEVVVGEGKGVVARRPTALPQTPRDGGKRR
jgi:enediyne biosynthesis protein E4